MISSSHPTTVRCLTPDCKKPASRRGLCQGCAISARRLINSGNTSWEELEELGLAIEPTVARKGYGDFMQAFIAAKLKSRVRSTKHKKRAVSR